MRRALPLLTLLLLAACRPEGREADSRPIHAADSVLAETGRGGETASEGVEYEAPRLIPGMRAHLEQLRRAGGSGEAAEAGLTTYKNMAGSLVDAMLVDLNRVGSPEAEEIRALGDTVLNLVGGGTGVPDAGPEEVARSAELMQGLIERYQEAMRAARP